jgi:hypothetical protein
LTFRVPVYKKFKEENKNNLAKRKYSFKRKIKNKFRTILNNDIVFQNLIKIQDDYDELLPQMLF